ncbi:MAG: hypothetical protein FJ109_03810 [Deltaproteobacteria bacterium]|nr:hypothetical protein [Deltaproteobacteria bacterium]
MMSSTYHGRARSLLLSLLVAASLAGGCSGAGLSLRPPTAGAQLDYEDTLDRWTRGQRLYRSFETLAVVNATYFSEEFLAAYMAEYRHVFNPLPAELEALSGKLRSRQERRECFFVSAFTGERDWNDFALANSTWKIYLRNDRGGRARSAQVTQVDKTDPMYRHFFPHFKDFYQGYLVCFDRVLPQEPGDAGLPSLLLDPAVRLFRLELRSTIGHVALEWELDN